MIQINPAQELEAEYE
jgi:hypothetical protein